MATYQSSKLISVTCIAVALVSVAQCKSEDLKEVYGVVTGSAHLPCNVTSPTPGDSPRLVLWYKDDKPQPVYSLDAR